MKGNIPVTDSLFEVVINEQAYKYLKDEFKKDPLGQDLSLNYEYESV